MCIILLKFFEFSLMIMKKLNIGVSISQCQSNPQPDFIRNLSQYKSLVIKNNNQMPEIYQNENSPLLKATDIENSFYLNLEN